MQHLDDILRIVLNIRLVRQVDNKSTHAVEHMLQLIQHRDRLPFHRVILLTENLPNPESEAQYSQNRIFMSKPSQDSAYAVRTLDHVYLCYCSG